MQAFDNLFNHISKTIQAPPTATITRYPRLASKGFRDVDSSGGARGDLEEHLGQDRVFEIQIESISVTPLLLGGPAPSAYGLTFPIRVRYEGQGPHRKRETVQQITEDQTAIVDALHRSLWSSISGLASLQARPGNITRFVMSDDGGNNFEGYLGSVNVAASIDI